MSNSNETDGDIHQDAKYCAPVVYYTVAAVTAAMHVLEIACLFPKIMWIYGKCCRRESETERARRVAKEGKADKPKSNTQVENLSN